MQLSSFHICKDVLALINTSFRSWECIKAFEKFVDLENRSRTKSRLEPTERMMGKKN
jgi:hypothetical protein